MNTKLAFFTIAIVLIGGVGYMYSRYTQNETPPINTSETKNIYTDTEYSFSFAYPPEYEANSYSNDGKSLTVYIKQKGLQKENYTDRFQMFVSSKVTSEGFKYCHLGFCDIPAQSIEQFNNIMWDYIGNRNYSDVGETSKYPNLYRTEHNNFVYYFSFNSTDQAKEVLKTFVFTN